MVSPSPSGLVHDGSHLIVADSGNNRLQVLGPDGQVVATITHYQHEGKSVPLDGPTALAIDHEQHLYVLIASKPKRPTNQEIVERTLPSIQQDYLAAAQTSSDDFTRLIKLKSWREPQLLAASAPLHPDVLQIAVDAGTSPPWCGWPTAPVPEVCCNWRATICRSRPTGETTARRCPVRGRVAISRS